MPKLLPAELPLVTRYIHEICGVALDATKTYLIEARLGPLADRHQCRSFTDLCQRAKADATHALSRAIVDAITTNETSFFRDTAPFELLQHKILPDLIDARRKTSASLRIRVWSAACSTGQEVYSIAMVFKELLVDLMRHDLRILGTDISSDAVARASRGIYTDLELQRGLGDGRCSRHFQRDGANWKIKDELRALATFRTFNLMGDCSPLGTFDIVFCRNVAIYFGEADRIALFRKLGQALPGDGYLVIGSTESLSGIAPQFEPHRYLRSVFYRHTGPRA